MHKLFGLLLHALVCFGISSFSYAVDSISTPIFRIEPSTHTSQIARIATDQSGRWLITAAQDKTARVWDLADGRLLRTLRIPIGNDNEGKLSAVALSPDGKTVALGGSTMLGSFGDIDHSLYLYDLANGKMVRRITGLPDVALHLVFSPDGHYIATTFHGNNGLRLYSADDGRLLAADQNYEGDSYSVDINADGDIVTTSYDGFLRLYSFEENVLKLEVRVVAPGGKQPFSARFSHYGNRIALGFHDTAAVQVLRSSNLSVEYAPDTKGVEINLLGVAWSTDDTTLYAAGNSGKLINGEIRRSIRRWPQAGKGKPVDWPVEGNSVIANLLSLPDNRLVFNLASAEWGVLNEQGKREIFISPALPDFRLNQSGFALSADGTQIRFGYEFRGKDSVVFDTVKRTFLSADNPGMSPPTMTAPGMEVTDWKSMVGAKLNGRFLRLKSDELSRSLAFLPNNNGFVLGMDWSLRSFDKTGKPRWQQPAVDTVWAVNVSQDGHWVVAAYGDGTIRWHRASDGVEQLAFFPHPDKKRWIMWTPEGYYDASPGGEELIGWHLNQGKDQEARFIPSSQLYDVFYRPDIVQAKFRGDDISGMITVTAAQALKSPPPMLSFTKIPSATKRNIEKVCYKAVSTGGGIGEVRLFQNGKLIKSDGFYRETATKESNENVQLASLNSTAIQRALKLTKVAQKAEPPLVSSGKGNTYEDCQELETIPGENEISVAAFNAQNTVQSQLESVHFISERKAEEPQLYVLGIGIDQYGDPSSKLEYAVKDAKDFSALINAKAVGLYKAENIHIKGLSNAAATKNGIQNAIQAISAKVKPWDSFILFVASHGALLDNQYYIVTAEYDGTVNTNKMISSNEIVGMSKNIKSLSQLLIFDTCHAGGVDNIIGGLYDARMSVMAKKMGLHIYASAGGTQTALDGYKGNGLFTHTLINSMNSAAATDTNHDKEVSVVELGQQARKNTMEISLKLGSPQSPNIINFGKDNALFQVK
jgi:WD40 repeat protein